MQDLPQGIAGSAVGGLKDVIDPLFTYSPPVLLAIVIIMIVHYVKRIPVIQSWHIPLVAMAIGAIVFPFIADTAKVPFNVRNPTVLNMMYGLAIGGLAIAFHQVFKLGKERREEIKDEKAAATGNTEFRKALQKEKAP